jgi:dihydrofolate reductase
MKVVAIAAVAKNGVIGSENALPWDIPEDMRFFRQSTKNHVVIMGRKTYDSMGRPLPHRENAVISRNPSWTAGDAYSDQVKRFSSASEAISYYRTQYAGDASKIIFVIGGSQIYESAFDLLDEVWLTEIDATVNGDAVFPFYREGRLQRSDFNRISSRPGLDLGSKFQYSFNVYSKA